VGGRENKGNLEGEINEYLEEKAPVEIIYERQKRFHTNEIAGRERVRLREEKGGRAGKQRQLGRGNRRIS
jgi:hypothetical protein